MQDKPIKKSRRRPRRDRELAERMLLLLRQDRDLRQRKARRLRGKIRAKMYENDLKLQIALDKMMRDALGPSR